MAKQIINLGTSPNKGDGDPLRTAFDKVNDNFDELYLALGNPSGATTDVLPNTNGTINLGSADKAWADLHVADFIYLNGAKIEVTAGGALLVNGGAPAEVQDTVGSVFGDDSTLLVDGVNNIIPSANISGTEASNWDTAFLWGDHSAAGYAPQETTYTKAEVDLAIAAVDPFSGDVTGSVFADDSTLLVDGVTGKIVGDVENSIVYTDIVYARSSDLYVNADDQASLYLGATNSQTIIIGASDSTIYLNGNQDSLVGAGKFFSPRGTDLNIATLDMTTGSADAVIIKGGETSDSDLSAFGGNVKINAGRNSNALQQHGDIQIGTEFTNGVTIGTYDGGDGFGNTVSLAGYTVIVGNSNNLSNIQLKGNVDFSDAKVSNLDVELSGDLSGSVFGDDSTLLVDGVNGVIPTSVLEGDITNPIRTGDVVIESTTSPGSITLTQTGIGNISLSATAIDFNNSPIENFLLSYITSGLTAPGSSVVAGNTEVTFNFSGSPTALTVEQDAITIGSGVTVDGFVGDVTGSVFGDDSTLLVDGVGGTIAGPISSINWMAAYDGYLTISNGGSTGPGPIQIIASANLNLSSGTNNDINITPHGSGRVKVSDGAFGIVEAANFIGHADETMYLSSKTTGAESTHIALDSTSGIATTMYGAVDFVSGGSVDFTGSTVTGLPNATITNEVGGSATLAVGSVMSVDYLNVRLIDKGTTLGVEFNYDPADFTSVIDAYSDDTSVGNVFNGSSNVTVGNTTWTEVTTLGTIGDRITFTLTDHSSHRVYRVTVTMRSVPDGGTIGDAYAIIETLK